MLRWSILLTAFTLWAASLALVYYNYRARPLTGLDAETQATLETLFDENGPTRSSWRIYVDMNDLQSSNRKPVPWDGNSEERLEPAGTLETNIIRKPNNAALNEETKCEIQIPNSAVTAHFTSSARLNSEQGLESSNVKLKIALPAFEFDVLSQGTRDGQNLNLVTSILQNGVSIHNSRRTEVLAGKMLPNVDLAPFQASRTVGVGTEWTVQMLDIEAVLRNPADAMTSVRVKCKGRQSIHLDGEIFVAYDVRSDDGQTRAWYSASGEVLKQTFRFGGLVRIMMVRQIKESAALPTGKTR